MPHMYNAFGPCIIQIQRYQDRWTKATLQWLGESDCSSQTLEGQEALMANSTSDWLWSRPSWLQGLLGIFQGSRPGFDSPWQSSCHPCCWLHRIFLLCLLFSTPLLSTANLSRLLPDYWWSETIVTLGSVMMGNLNHIVSEVVAREGKKDANLITSRR